MSDATLAALKAAEVNAVAAAWLRRRHFGAWTEEDVVQLEAWLAQSPANRVAYWRLNAAWGRMDRMAALNIAQTDKNAAKASSSMGLKIAAAFVAVTMLTAGVGISLLQPREKTYATGLGEQKTITLADGSAIELNTNTVVHLSVDSKSRFVRLERGEAYFQIKHDPKRLFVVLAGDHRVTDVGTQFLVRREPNHLEVALVEGRARFDMPESKSQVHSMSLAAGDVVVATANHTTLTRQLIRDLTSELGWRRGVLVFKHATLAEAAAEFNRYNPEKIIIADETAGNLTLNGTFKTNDVAAFTDAAHAVFGLKVDIRDREIVISR